MSMTMTRNAAQRNIGHRLQWRRADNGWRRRWLWRHMFTIEVPLTQRIQKAGNAPKPLRWTDGFCLRLWGRKSLVVVLRSRR